jgi:hypothetical protein
MPVQGMQDISPREVTPDAGEGTLGTWRFRAGPEEKKRTQLVFIVVIS